MKVMMVMVRVVVVMVVMIMVMVLILVMIVVVTVVMVHCCSKNLIIAPAAWARTEGSLSPSNTTRCGTHPTLQAWFFPSRGKLATNRGERRVDEHERMME